MNSEKVLKIILIFFLVFILINSTNKEKFSDRVTPKCDDGSSAKCCDGDGSCFDGDDDWCCGKDNVFFCSNDGREYAESQGGKLCPDPKKNQDLKNLELVTKFLEDNKKNLCKDYDQFESIYKKVKNQNFNCSSQENTNISKAKKKIDKYKNDLKKLYPKANFEWIDKRLNKIKDTQNDNEYNNIINEIKHELKKRKEIKDIIVKANKYINYFENNWMGKQPIKDQINGHEKLFNSAQNLYNKKERISEESNKLIKIIKSLHRFLEVKADELIKFGYKKVKTSDKITYTYKNRDPRFGDKDKLDLDEDFINIVNQIKKDQNLFNARKYKIHQSPPYIGKIKNETKLSESLREKITEEYFRVESDAHSKLNFLDTMKNSPRTGGLGRRFDMKDKHNFTIGLGKVKIPYNNIYGQKLKGLWKDNILTVNFDALGGNPNLIPYTQIINK